MERKKTSKKDNKLKKVFNIYLLESLICSIAILGVGVFLLLKPETATRTAEILTSIVLIAVAMASGFNYALNEKFSFFKGSIVTGVAAALTAFVIITNPFSLTKMLVFAIGVYLVISSAIKFYYAFSFKRDKEESWILMLMMAVMSLLFGGLTLCSYYIPLANLYYTQAGGLFLILHGVIELTQTALLKQRCEELINIYK